MCYVDVAPMITAFREHPEQFDIRSARLGAREFIFDRKSKHRLFNDWGEWRLVPACDCQADLIALHQQDALDRAIVDWKLSYWAPLLRARETEAAENTARIEARVARNKQLLNQFADKVTALVTFRWLRRPAALPTPANYAALAGSDD